MRILVGLACVLAACQPPQAGQTRNADAASSTSRASASEDSNSPEEVGLYRWSSGMQMGQFWAAVLNKKDDTLRLIAENEEGDPVGWAPIVELADGSKLPPGGGVLNFVVGSQAVTFGYETADGQPEIQLLGNDGANRAARAVDLIRNASGAPVCIEFPDIDYVSCFSTKGASEALGGG